MKQYISYAGALKLSHSSAAEQLAVLQQKSGIEFVVDNDGWAWPTKTHSLTFVEGGPEHERFLQALEASGLRTHVTQREAIYEDADLAILPYVLAWVPWVERKVHKSPHPGTLMYSGPDLPFVGWEIAHPRYRKRIGTLPSPFEPILIDGKPLARFEIAGLADTPSLFVSDSFRKLWETHSLHGLHFWNCVDTGRDAEKRQPYYGVCIDRLVDDIAESRGTDEPGLPRVTLRKEVIPEGKDIILVQKLGKSDFWLLFSQRAYQATKHIKDLEWSLAAVQ